jgi:predicted permease
MSFFSDLVERVRSLVFRRHDERELDEELRFHLEMEAELRRQSGADTAEARRQSALALGGLDRTKEDVRDASGTRWLNDAWADVALAIRVLRQRPTFTIVAVLTLAIGIGGTTAVFSAVDRVLIEPLPFAHPGQLVRLYHDNDHRHEAHGFVTPVHFVAYHDRLHSFDHLAAMYTYTIGGGDITTDDGARRVRVLQVSADYFDVLATRLEAGRPFAGDGADLRTVVLSHELWVDRFRGQRTAIGQTLLMSGVPYVVAGVMPAGFTDPVVGGLDAWTPMDLAPGRDLSNVDNHYVTVIGRLRPGVTLGAAQAELDALGVQLANEYPDAKTTTASLSPLKDDIVGGSSRALELMLGAAAAVLLLVCVNVANLFLVRGSEREREFALRRALGAGRSRIARQLLAESLVLALVGDLGGLLFARLAMRSIVTAGGASIPRLTGLSLDPRLLLFSIAIASACAIIVGLVPAIRAGQADPNDALRGETRSSTGGRSHARLRSSLVVSQVALAFVLVVAAGLLVASVRRLRELDLGIQPKNVLTFELHLPRARYDSIARVNAYADVPRRLETIPGVVAAGGVSKLPATGPFHQWGVRALTGPLVGTPRAGMAGQQRVITGDYLKAVGIRVVEGRDFDASDTPPAPNRVLVSKSLAAKLFPGVDAIGQRLQAGSRKAEIIGVVSDVSMDAEGVVADYVYHPHMQFAGDRVWELAQVVATTRPPESIAPDVRRVLAAIDPQLVMYQPMPLTDAIGQGEAQRVFTLRLLTSFALMSLGLAALGLFGVLSYGVKLRTREIGIRVALGAQRGAIRQMVLRQGLSMTAVGIGVGLVGALAASRVMTSLVFHVSPADPLVLAGAAMCMVVVAGLAAYLPARRATTVDPRTALQ